MPGGVVAEGAAVVGRKDATDRCLPRPERIQRQPLAALREALIESGDGAACLHGCGHVAVRVFEDAVQPAR